MVVKKPSYREAQCDEQSVVEVLGDRLSVSGNRWAVVLDAAGIAAYHDLTRKLDPAFAAREEAYWRSCTRTELETTIAWAWRVNDPDRYQLARSYLALQGAAGRC